MSNAHEIQMPGVSDVLETVLFKTIWDRMSPRSFITGFWLRSYACSPLWKNCFMRVLPVKDYKYFASYFGNIVLCTPGEKALYEQASEEERISYALDVEEKSRGKGTADWQAVKDLAEELKVLYKQNFPSTRGIMVNYSYSLEEQQKILGKLNREFWENFNK